MNGFDLKAALKNGERVYGCCTVSPSPHWPAMMAGTGLDFIFIDTEHIALDRSQVAWMCQTYAALGLAPIVRIPKPDPYLACMVLDAGAQGVVAPYMESLEEIRDLRGAVKFRPLKGQRLNKVLEDSSTLDEETAQYIAVHNRNNLLIVNIESVAAVEALDTLLDEPDIDAVLIGPHDLSISLGIAEQYEHPRFTEAMTTIIEKARSRNIGVGYHFSFGLDIAIAWAERGANFIVHSTDYFLVRDALNTELTRFRNKLGDPVRESAGGMESSGPAAI